jgi:K(+)-stimulated pyrophosphate-energized sodium pump
VVVIAAVAVSKARDLAIGGDDDSETAPPTEAVSPDADAHAAPGQETRSADSHAVPGEETNGDKVEESVNR